MEIFYVRTNELLGKQECLAAVENLQMLRSNICEYGFLQPVILDDKGRIVAGCEQFLAAVSIGWVDVPCVWKKDLTEEEFSYAKTLLRQELCSAEWDAIAASLGGP